MTILSITSCWFSVEKRLSLGAELTALKFQLSSSVAAGRAGPVSIRPIILFWKEISRVEIASMSKSSPETRDSNLANLFYLFCFFVFFLLFFVYLVPRNVRFEPRMAYSYVLGSTWLGEITSVTLVWTYSSSVFNPLTWRILTVPSLHVNRIIVHNLESNSR